MVALDILGRRGALRVLWELRGQPLTFRALQCGRGDESGVAQYAPQGVAAMHVVDHSAEGYLLTAQGRSLMTALEPVQAWADDWAREADR